MNWYAQRGVEVPYYQVDVTGKPDLGFYPRVVESTCPCAGLSMLNPKAKSENQVNDWMVNTAEFVLSEWRPSVYWGENAPGLMGNLGRGVRDRLHAVAAKHDYSVGYYKTKSLLHGVPQVRTRSFYFFWNKSHFLNGGVPELGWFDKPYTKIEDLIVGVKSNSQREPINKKRPSEEPFYRYVLEEVAGGMSHRQYAKSMGAMPVRTNDSKSIIEQSGHDYTRVSEWMRKQGLDKLADRCLAIKAKLDAGGSIMRRDTIVPKDYIGAFVGHYPHMLAHPTEDRYIDYREAMTIMGLPDDFELVDPNPRNVNHVCQNVPVQTASDMATEVMAALNGKRPVAPTSLLFQSNVNRTTEYHSMEGKTNGLDGYF